MELDPTIEVDEEAKAEYTEFRDLEIGTETTFDSTLKLSQSQFWKDVFSAIDDLRKLNKFNKLEFEENVGMFTTFIGDQVNNL